jgi:hypothetical protein
MSERIIDATNLASIDPGDYDMVIEKAEIKKNKNNTGEVIAVYAVEKETNENVTMFFNVFHENAKAQSIGQKQFKRFLRACGLEKCDLDNVNGTLEMKTLKVSLEQDGEYLKVTKYIEKTEAGAQEKKDDFSFA